jgi:hypothetical protein
LRYETFENDNFPTGRQTNRYKQLLLAKVPQNCTKDRETGIISFSPKGSLWAKEVRAALTDYPFKIDSYFRTVEKKKPYVFVFSIPVKKCFHT